MLFKKTIAAAALLTASVAAATTANAQFDGAYFGATGAVNFQDGDTYFNAGAIGGYDFQFNQFVVGIGTRATYTFGFPDPDEWINLEGALRAGVAFGNVLAYGIATLGASINGPSWWSLGGGVEFGISQSVHVFAEARRAWLSFGEPATAIQAGVVLRRP